MIKVFVAVPSTFSEEHKQFLDRIIAFFKNDQKYKLALDLQWFTKEKRKKDFFEAETRGLEYSDFLVAEISYPSVGVGFLISYAVMKKKKILCLYKENIHKTISAFITSIPKNKITIKKYDNESLEPILSEYFAKTKPFKLHKFNFIISQKIKDYLDWLSQDSTISLSEKLRNIVEEKIIDTDKEYDSYLKKDN